MIAALLPIIAELIPGFIKAFGASKDDAPLERLANIVKETTKADDPDKIRAAIAQDLKLKQELQEKLATTALEELKELNRAEEQQREIDLEFYREELVEKDRVREAEFREYMRDLQDRQEARKDWVQLASDRNPLAWVGPFLAVILMLLIFYCLRGILVAEQPIINRDVFNIVLGALVTGLTTVISFYFGSSIGSQRKDNLVASGRLVPSGGVEDGRPPPASGELNRAESERSTSTLLSSLTRKRDAQKPRTIAQGPLAQFAQKAPGIMRQLVNDLALTPAQAAGILGNLGHESGGFRFYQEISPLAGRGGAGWAQWTGPRRRAFEAWSAERGLDPRTDDASYGFLIHELKGTEQNSLRSLRRTTTVEAATADFMDRFERPGIKGLEKRLNFANLAMREYGRAYDA